jgi:hypothetical protein
VADGEPSAAECIDGRDVGAAVVADDARDGDAVSAVVGDGAAEERGGGGRLLVGEDLCVGEP